MRTKTGWRPSRTKTKFGAKKRRNAFQSFRCDRVVGADAYIGPAIIVCNGAMWASSHTKTFRGIIQRSNDAMHFVSFTAGTLVRTTNDSFAETASPSGGCRPVYDCLNERIGVGADIIRPPFRFKGETGANKKDKARKPLRINDFRAFFGRGTKDRTRDTRFWRPMLYQLSYTPISGGPSGTRTPDRPVMSRLL